MKEKILNITLNPRHHNLIFRIVTSSIAAGFTYYVTESLPYYPLSWRWLLVFASAAIWFFKMELGLFFTLAIYILPIVYNSIILLLIYLPVFLAVFVLGPYGFIVLSAATIISTQTQLWFLIPILPLLAGFYGYRRGPILAALTCFWVEILALLGGKASLGVIVSGQRGDPLISVNSTPVNSLLDFNWYETQASGADLLPQLFKPFVESPILISQIILWAAVAGIMAFLLFKLKLRNWYKRAIALGSGALIAFVGHLILPMSILETRIETFELITGIFMSALLVLAISPVLEIMPLNLMSSFKGKEELVYTNFEAGISTKIIKGEAPSDNWDELAGIDEIKSEIMEIIKSQFDSKTRSALNKMSIKPTKGVLLFGPPGTGKTKLARIIAKEAKASFFTISGTEFTSKWYGESEANLRRIFENARSNKPSVLFFDELEAFLPRRENFSRSDAPEKGIVATFLAYADGIYNLDGVLLIGATNYPDLIDPAALRPGRFDKLIYIAPPGVNARHKILELFLKGKPLSNDIDLNKLAERMERFTGADIQSVIIEAVKSAMKRGGGKLKAITMSDIEIAISGVKPSVTKKMLKEYEALSDQYTRGSRKLEIEEVVSKPVLNWDDVAGLKDVKEALKEMIEMPLAHPELFKEYNIKPGKGILLFGPPGCGKTFLAKVVASESKAHFLHVKGPELLQQFVGKSEALLQDLFDRAHENAPSIIFFDEIDAIAGARGTDRESGTKILTQFLLEMDGIEELKGIIVVAATNRPDMIDPALMRPGRLDRILYVPPPDYPARLELFKRELKSRPLSDDIDYNLLADLSEGYSAADIISICNAVAMDVAKETLSTGNRQLIQMERIKYFIEHTARSIAEEQLLMYEKLKERLQR